MNETALKERLKVIAKNKGLRVNEIWKQLLLERFLARLSKSDFQEKFIFKGGLLLAQRIEIGRETTDIDFLMTKIKSETSAIEKAFRKIALFELLDGFQFELQNVEALAQPHMEYLGYRANFHAKFGKMKDKIQVDIGVGDSVNPVEDRFHPFEYKGKPLFEGEITLLTYPVETIFSEKLETVFSKGALNSRMKDYHDIALMIREPGLLNIKKLKASISATFKNRDTILHLPLVFDEAGSAALQNLWTSHLSGLGAFRQKLNLPEAFGALLTEVNAWFGSNELTKLGEKNA